LTFCGVEGAEESHFLVLSMSAAAPDLSQQPIDVVELDSEGQVARRAFGLRSSPGQVIVLDDEDSPELPTPSRTPSCRRLSGASASTRPFKRPRRADENPSTTPTISIDVVGVDDDNETAVPGSQGSRPSAPTIRRPLPGCANFLGGGIAHSLNSPNIPTSNLVPTNRVAGVVAEDSFCPHFDMNDMNGRTVVIEDDDDEDEVVTVCVGINSGTGRSNGVSSNDDLSSAVQCVNRAPLTPLSTLHNGTPWFLRRNRVLPPSTRAASSRAESVVAQSPARGIAAAPIASGRQLTSGLLLQLFNAHLLSSSARDMASLDIFRQALFGSLDSRMASNATSGSRAAGGSFDLRQRNELNGPSGSNRQASRRGGRNTFGAHLRDNGLTYEALSRLDDMVDDRRLGASSAQIRALPTRRASSLDASLTCCVCLSDVEIGEELRILPCTHQYHKKCIDVWLKRNACCPVDKRRIDH
jgi:RING-like zinc finger